MLYAAITVTKDGKYQSFYQKIDESENLVEYTTNKVGLAEVKTLNIFKTWKDAVTISEFWNDCYKKNGTYLEDCYH